MSKLSGSALERVTGLKPANLCHGKAALYQLSYTRIEKINPRSQKVSPLSSKILLLKYLLLFGCMTSMNIPLKLRPSHEGMTGDALGTVLLMVWAYVNWTHPFLQRWGSAKKLATHVPYHWINFCFLSHPGHLSFYVSLIWGLYSTVRQDKNFFFLFKSNHQYVKELVLCVSVIRATFPNIQLFLII